MSKNIFSTGGSGGGSQAFQDWQAGNAQGFYINLKTQAYGMLHRVDCLHVGSPSEWNPELDVTSSTKVCHPDRSELLGWAKVDHVDVVECGTCKP